MRLAVLDSRPSGGRRLPPWLKRPLPTGDVLRSTREIVQNSGVATVCEEARCPNLSECWSRKHATFMILGDRCTRSCKFCAVNTARPLPPESDEPVRVARAAAELDLRHIVLTAVARDDLPDEGASHFAECVREVRRRLPECAIEVLPADFHARDECIRVLCDAGPDIYNHNQETTERLSPRIRPSSNYRRSLAVLSKVKEILPEVFTKSGLMVGLGETRREFSQSMRDLRAVGVNILTVGQYLQPSPQHAPGVARPEPREFEEIAEEARQMGFNAVASGPFVRSSYNAAEVYEAISKQRGRNFVEEGS